MFDNLINSAIYSKEKMLTYFLSIIAFSIPLGIAFYNIAIVIFIVFCIYLFISKKGIDFKFDIKSDKGLLLLLVFVSISAFTLLYTSDISRGIFNLSKIIQFTFIALIFKSIKIKPNINVVVYSFISSCLLLGLYVNTITIIQILNSGEELLMFVTHYHRNFILKLYPEMLQPMYYSIYLLAAWLFLIFISNYKTFFSKLIFIVLSSYIFFLIYIFSSKVSILFVVVFSVIFMIVKAFKQADQKRVFLSSSLFIVLSAGLFYFFRLELLELLFGTDKTVFWRQDLFSRFRYFMENGDLSRIENWQACISLYKDNFLLGVGVGDVANDLQQYRLPNSWAFIEKANTHNQYLNFSLIGGLFTIIPFLGFILFEFKNSFNKKNLLLSFYLVLFIVFMFVENVLDRHAGIVFFSFFLFLLKYFYEEKINYVVE